MAHAAPTAPRRHSPDLHHLDRSAYVRPLMWGLVYGIYAAFLQRQTGPVDAGNVFYGILCGVLFAAGVFALSRMTPRVTQELRAAAWGAFAGVAMGYLYSLTGDSVLRSTGIGLLVGAGVGITAFYRYHTREP
ncbi:hypothetical protein [Streptomyces sp. NPDC012888]|uniref:hypothetical protein n=1 Tax=Streptomyces sp. NPDC012888 TaxID=3364855 RepID=UPI0036854EBB